MNRGCLQPSDIGLGHQKLLTGRRIVVVLESLELGGAESQAVRLAERLVHQYSAEVQVWGFADEGRAARMCESAGIPWRLVRPNWGDYRLAQWLNAAARFAYLLRKAHAEILLPYCARSNVICGLAWRLAGTKACIWNQRDEGRGLTPSSWANQWAVKNTLTFVSNSQVGAEFLNRAFALPLERISIIHNGVELAPAVYDRVSWRKHLGVEPQTFLACMVANIHSYKDHATLLKAWKIVLRAMRSKNREAVLLLAGWLHPHADTVKALASQLNLLETVRFLGPVDDVTGLLLAVDLGVFSSKTEGCPNAILEYMASGLPIVATDILGVREAIGPTGLEYLAAPDDTDSFAQKILAIAERPSLASSLGKVYRERIRADFSPDQMVAKMVAQILKATDRRILCGPSG